MSSYWLTYRGTWFPLRRGETLIGRSPYCTIVLSNPRASRRHCAIKLERGDLWLEDLSSSNGTWVNDTRLSSSRQLVHGDFVRIGTDVLEVRFGPSESAKVVEVGRETADQEAGFEGDVSTRSHALTVELIEALVSGAVDSRDPAQMSDPIRRSIDAMLVQRAQASLPLDVSERTRLSAAVEIIASWDRSPLSEAWRLRIVTLLGVP